jgi:nucleoside 2-deoxyribosyltransferase
MLKPDHTPYRIYCAGPLFNPSERAEMEMLAETLEQAGFETFLPHRDGLLFGVIVPDLMKASYPLEAAQWMARQAIFALDVYHVLMGCDGALINLNGRVPDEGALVEGAIAWTAGKAVVLFKDDARALIAGLDNPLVAGLGSFRFVSHTDDLPRAMSRALSESASDTWQMESLTAVVRQGVERGQRLAEVAGTGNSAQLVRTIIQLFDEFQGAARNPARLSP